MDTQAVKSCRACVLVETCKAPVPGEGNTSSPLMLVGESPGFQEDRFGKPFTGRSGNELNRYLEWVGIQRDDIYVTNVVKCHPEDNRDPEQEEIDQCIGHLHREVAHIKPRVIGAMGGISTRSLLGDGFGLDRNRGIPQWCNINGHWCIVVPMLHPVLGLHSSAKSGMIKQDFVALKKALTGQIEPDCDKILKPHYDLLTDRDADWFMGYLWSGGSDVFLDTETLATGEPWSVQVTMQEGEGYMFLVDDSPQLLSVLKDFLETEGIRTVMHFAKFDLRVLWRIGIRPVAWADTMECAYLLEGEPQGLKDLAYRHHHMIMSKFKEMVRGATEKRFVEYFHEIMKHDWPPPPTEKEWCPDPKLEYEYKERWVKCTKRHSQGQVCPECHGKSRTSEVVVECGLCEGTGFARRERKRTGRRLVEPGTENGYWRIKQPQPIERKVKRLLGDLEKNPDLDVIDRWKNYSGPSVQMVAKKLGPLIPCDLRHIPLKDAIYYSCRDADATCRTFKTLWPLVVENGLQPTHDLDMEILPMIMDMEKEGMHVDREAFKALHDEYVDRQDVLELDITDKLGKKINLRSPLQLCNMLYNQLRIKPTKFNKKTKTPSTDDEALSDIQFRHPAIPQIMVWRKLEKNREFSESIPSCADKNSRVHSTIKTTRTVTGRLASANPNLMNIPTRSEDGKKIRTCFTASEGCMLLSGDYGQIEMRVPAHVADDKAMQRVFNEGLDMHSFTASQIFGIPMSAVDKDKHRTPAKTVGFGVLYQISPEGLLDQMIAAGCKGWTVESCKDMIRDWFDVYSGIRDYFTRMKSDARRFGYVTDMYGRRYYIPEIRSSCKYIRGEGERNACSYTIQGAAQQIMKRGMSAMTQVYPLYQQMGYVCRPLIQIHDDLVWEVSEDIVFEFADVFKGVMESADSLKIPLEVECKIGYSWGEMFEI